MAVAVAAAKEREEAKMKPRRKRGMTGGDDIVGDVAEKRSQRNVSIYKPINFIKIRSFVVFRLHHVDYFCINYKLS